MAKKSMKEHLLERVSPKTIAKEVMETLSERIVPQGAAEMAQAINTGNGYVPYGSGQEPVEPIAPSDAGGIHGVSAAEQPQPSPETTREAAYHNQQADWFAKSAAVERQTFTAMTPPEQENRLDQWQGMAQASRENNAERGTVPPIWAVQSRDEMRAAFTAEPQQNQQPASPGVAGQSAKDRLLAANPAPQATYKAVDVSEIGPPLATPAPKQSAVPQKQIDPLDKARETAREASKGQGKSRSLDIGE